MKIKYIDKLEDLKNYKWCHEKYYFELRDMVYETLNLMHTNSIDYEGNMRINAIRVIGLQNLMELELYGLKIIINEKPKLTKKERYFLECHGGINIARDKNGRLNIYSGIPKRGSERWLISNFQIYLDLSDGIFDFISWESGKAWSKAELMELEVVD